jgi:hypothetical protein
LVFSPSAVCVSGLSATCSSYAIEKGGQPRVFDGSGLRRRLGVGVGGKGEREREGCEAEHGADPSLPPSRCNRGANP